MTIHLLGMTTAELEGMAESMGQPKFRGKQIARWIYKRNADTVVEMTDLPTGFRAELALAASLYHSSVCAASQSPDGTAKYLLEFTDGQQVESVLIPYEERVSVCVSTQVGCAAGCAFCATGIGGFSRNLSAGEIVDEVLTLQKQISRRVDHVVYMGMGEPLFNYDNVLKSVYLLTGEVGIAMRHITISTVGVTPKIQEMARLNLQLTLAISLHAPNDSIRNQIIPVSSTFPLSELMNACRAYTETTHRRITIEYLLLRKVNDSMANARELAILLRGMLCNVNLIPYNEVDGLDLKRPLGDSVKAFRAVLEDAGISVTQRMERGHSISAACGQLRRRSKRCIHTD